MFPPYSPILVRAAVRNIIIPYIAIYLFFPAGTSVVIRLLTYLLAPFLIYTTHVAIRTRYHRYRAWRLSAMMVPFVDPAFKPKGSPWYKRIGNLDLMIAWGKEGKEGYIGDGMAKYALEGAGGTVNTRILGEDSLITNNPQHIRQILSTSFAAFPKGNKFKERAKDLFGSRGVFVSDGADWNVHRSTTRPFFSRNNPAAFDPARSMEPHTTKLLDILLASRKTRPGILGDTPHPHVPDGSAVDIQSLFLTYTLDIATDLFFGHCVQGLDQAKTDRNFIHVGDDQTKDDAQGIAAAFAEAQAVLAQRIKMGTPWSLFEWNGNRMKKPVKVIKDFVRPLVDRAVSQQADRHVQTPLSEGTTSGETCHLTLLDHLVDTLDDRESIEDEVVNILVAARDTTAAALTYCVYCMILHPSSLEKLRAEVLAGPVDTAWTYARLQNLKYLNAFILEVLRLYPPVPLNIRRSACEVLLEGSPPLYVPAGTSIILATLLMQRNQGTWGEDSEKFVPERWLLQAKMTEGSKGRNFVPFSAGPRTCLGQGFASMQLSYFIVRLVQALTPDLNMKLDLNKGHKIPSSWTSVEQAYVTSSLTMYIKGGLWVIVDHVP